MQKRKEATNHISCLLCTEVQKIYQLFPFALPLKYILQSNLNSSNTDGAFSMANSSSFFESLRNSSDSSRKQIFQEIFVF